MKTTDKIKIHVSEEMINWLEVRWTKGYISPMLHDARPCRARAGGRPVGHPEWFLGSCAPGAPRLTLSLGPRWVLEDRGFGLVQAGLYSHKYQKGNMIDSTTHNVRKIKKLVTDKKRNCCWNLKLEKKFSSDSSQRTLCRVSWKMFSAMSEWQSWGVS